MKFDLSKNLHDTVVGGQSIRAKNRAQVYVGFLILFGALCLWAYWLKI